MPNNKCSNTSINCRQCSSYCSCNQSSQCSIPSLRGSRGPKGLVGPMGPVGPVGPPGNDGSVGISVTPYKYVQYGEMDGTLPNKYNGYSVAINNIGNRIIIGGKGESTSTSGAVQIYEWSENVFPNTWILIGDIAVELSDDFTSYYVSMNHDGSRIAIGTSRNSSVFGYVRVYDYQSINNWVQVGADIMGEDVGDYSGNSVSMNAIGDIVAIGASFNIGNNQSYSGHTRVYKWDTSNWVQIGADIDGENIYDGSGYSVSLNDMGDIIAIGAPYNIGNNQPYSGHTRVYKWDTSVSITNWIQIGADIDGENAGDISGSAVSMNASGTRVAIGAYRNMNETGHVRVYEWDTKVSTTNWTQVGTDIDGIDADDKLGFSVSMNAQGNRIVIGTIGLSFVSGGYASVYELNTTIIPNNWIKIGTNINGPTIGERTGSSVAINSEGDVIVIGSITRDTSNGTDSGRTRVYHMRYKLDTGEQSLYIDHNFP